MPAGTRSIYAFALFNALSFQMILGSPMVLYAKSLGANATTLGVIAGMTAMLVILQIPSAGFADRLGYKHFVVSGWSVRTIFVALMALVPLTGQWIPPGGRIAVLLGLLFLFNVSRGISTCGWLPWIASIIPAEHRGRYLVNDAAMVNLGSLAVFWFAAAVLGADPHPWQFSALFAFAALAAIMSLRFLRKIPEERRIETETANRSGRPPLSEMLSITPFRRLLTMNVGWSLANGGVLTFVVAYLKGMAGMSEQHILILVSFTFVGGLVNQLLLRRILDQHGSKPVLIAGCAVWTLLLAAWSLVAAGVWAHTPVLLGGLAFGIGLGSSLMNLSNLRLAMISAPEEGRSHYFALFSVVANVTLGVSPILWGVLVDASAGVSRSLGAFELNRFSLLFGMVSLCFAVTLILSTRLIEHEASNLSRLLAGAMENSRIRFWFRPWLRMPPRT